MCDQHIRPCFFGALNHMLRGIQSQIHPVHFFFRAAGQKSDIIKIKRGAPRISCLNYLYNLSAQHNNSVLSLYIPVPFPLLFVFP